MDSSKTEDLAVPINQLNQENESVPGGSKSINKNNTDKIRSIMTAEKSNTNDDGVFKKPIGRPKRVKRTELKQCKTLMDISLEYIHDNFDQFFYFYFDKRVRALDVLEQEEPDPLESHKSVVILDDIERQVELLKMLKTNTISEDLVDRYFALGNKYLKEFESLSAMSNKNV